MSLAHLFEWKNFGAAWSWGGVWLLGHCSSGLLRADHHILKDLSATPSCHRSCRRAAWLPLTSWSCLFVRISHLPMLVRLSQLTGAVECRLGVIPGSRKTRRLHDRVLLALNISHVVLVMLQEFALFFTNVRPFFLQFELLVDQFKLLWVKFRGAFGCSKVRQDCDSWRLILLWDALDLESRVKSLLGQYFLRLLWHILRLFLTRNRLPLSI